MFNYWNLSSIVLKKLYHVFIKFSNKAISIMYNVVKNLYNISDNKYFLRKQKLVLTKQGSHLTVDSFYKCYIQKPIVLASHSTY